MIAGTYTPFAVVAIGGAWGTGLLVFVWTVAVAGVLLKLLDPGRLEMLSIAAYLSLGWTIIVAIDHLIAAVSLRRGSTTTSLPPRARRSRNRRRMPGAVISEPC